MEERRREDDTRLGALSIDELAICTIRTLAMDAVQKADSGHPGAPMALAPLAYLLFTQVLRHNPENPSWFNRDRFVLSNGHASMLLYATEFLCGYDLTLADIEHFRQWHSKTPGHPEYGHTPGVEVTTGPLGQGIMNAVGMAMAEAHLAALYNREGHSIIDHRTYAICSDGDMMEGASHEAASLAGHLRLGKLIVFYDDNHVTIDGNTNITFTDDIATRFRGYGWAVQNLGESANDLEQLKGAIDVAHAHADRPSLIIVRTHIGYGAPRLQDSPKAHGAPLGEEEVRATKRVYGWPEDAHFLVPERVREHMGKARERGAALEAQWRGRLDAYERDHPHLRARLEPALTGELPLGWDSDLPEFEGTGAPIATRKASETVLNHFANRIPHLIGGAADLASSTGARIADGGDFEPGNYAGRNIHWGIREHVMGAASSGLARHGLNVFASTFFIFTDYARPAIRLAALMGVPVAYVLTHDSIALGEDGPTHQPIEHLAAFRAMPNVHVIRPADANETVYAWRAALARRDGPTLLILTRQTVPVLDRSRLASADGLLSGGYVLAQEPSETPDLILIATGSEVALALTAQEELASRHGLAVRVVSLPSFELFRAQSREYRESVLPSHVTRRLAIEAAAPFGWCEWVGDQGDVIGIDHFGASAPGGTLLTHYGFSVENVIDRALRLMDKTIDR